MKRVFHVGMVLLAAIAVGCKDNTQELPKPPDSPGKVPTASTNAAAGQKFFMVKGLVESVRDDRTSARVKHEKIPDYMPAMTMDLAVKDTNELAAVKAGDAISFRMVITDDDAWIDQVKTIAESSLAPAKPTVRVTRDVEELTVGDEVPDYKFTNELGQAVSLSQFKGEAVALTFIFTTCPYPTYCPRMAQNFAAAAKQLKESSTAPKNWRLLCVTMDPDIDTPPVLQKYARTYNYDPKHWSFLTSDLTTITELGDQLGVMFWRAEGTISHNLRTVVIDSQGRLQKVFEANEWKPEELTEEIIKAAKTNG